MNPAPTPVGDDGAPLRTTPSWWPTEPADDVLERIVQESGGTPVHGAEVEVQGRRLIEVTFLWERGSSAVTGDGGGAAQDGPEVMVHLNTLTDHHREDVSGAILPRVPGTRWHALTYLLDPAAILQYALVVRERIPRDVGADRTGWMGVHADGQVDPRGAGGVLAGTFSGPSTLWSGPRASLHADWGGVHPAGCRSWARTLELGGADRRVTLLTGTDAAPQAPAPRLLVLWDGEAWRAHEVARRLGPRAGEIDVLLIDSGSWADRSRDLPEHERSAAILEAALAAARTATGAAWSAQDVILAGQSFGGLATADVVLRRPDLAAVGIAQSGSYWYGADAPLGTGHGTLLQWLEGVVDEDPGRLSGRLIVQVGAEEGDMVDGSARLVETLAPTGVVHAHEVWQGGHDHAWWRHGLSRALDALASGA